MTSTRDILDSRDLQERIDELEAEEDLDEADKEELENLRNLKEEVSNEEEWESGITFINENYWEDYARDFAEDIGAIGQDNQWPVYCIDWEWAAREIAMDYSTVEFDGETYYYRAY